MHKDTIKSLTISLGIVRPQWFGQVSGNRGHLVTWSYRNKYWKHFWNLIFTSCQIPCFFYNPVGTHVCKVYFFSLLQSLFLTRPKGSCGRYIEMLTWSSSSRIIQFIKKVKTWILWLSQYPPPFDTLGGVQNSECIEGFSMDTHYFRVVSNVSFGLFCHSFCWYTPLGEKDKIPSGPVQQKKA